MNASSHPPTGIRRATRHASRGVDLPDAIHAERLLTLGLMDEASDALQVDVRIVPRDDGNTRHATRRIGRYELRGEIDHGGVGIVHRAWQADLQREVALKVLLDKRLDSADMRARFLREAELMAGLDHPGILPVFEVGEQDGVPWYAMKLAEGGSLAARIDAYQGRFQDSARLLASLARAMQHAHEHGVLHRDLKPSNVVFDASGQAMITDFGLGRRLTADRSLTGFDALIGTPHYVAPEVVTTPADELTPAVDIYGLGAILHELLTGQPPYAELTPVQLLRQITTRRPALPQHLRADIPAALAMICLRCLEKRPDDRYASAGALASALEEWLAAPPPRDKRWTVPLLRGIVLPSRRRMWMRVAMAVMAAISIGTAFTVYKIDRTPGMADLRSSMRSVAVIPVGLPTPPPAEIKAAQVLTAGLQQMHGLTAVPVERTLQRARTPDFARSLLHRSLALGAYLQVQVLADSQAPGATVHVRAIDALRHEIVWQGQADAAHLGTLTQPLGEAVRNHQRLASSRPSAPAAAWAALAKGDAAYARLDARANDAAIDAYKHAIALAPTFALAHASLSMAYSQRSNRFGDAAYWNDSAIEEAERAVRLDPTLADAEYALGYAYYTKGWWQRSIQAYERAHELGGIDNTELALNYYGLGRFEDSFRLYQKDLAFSPGKPAIHYLGAQTLLTLGATAAGERWMRKAIASEADAGKRNLMEAEIALYRGDYSRCRALAGALDPALVSGGFYSAGELARRCTERQGDWAGALQQLWYEKQRYAGGKGDLGNAGPALEESVLLTQLGRHAEARTTLAAARRSAQAAIDAGREYPKVWLRMAAVQRLEGDVEGAYRTLDQAFAHGLTINARNRDDFELLPFHDDARFATLRDASLARVDAMRARVEALL